MLYDWEYLIMKSKLVHSSRIGSDRTINQSALDLQIRYIPTLLCIETVQVK